jgi:hypothetical protein
MIDSNDPDREISKEFQNQQAAPEASSGGIGCLALAGIAVALLFLAVLGLCGGSLVTAKFLGICAVVTIVASVAVGISKLFTRK